MEHNNGNMQPKRHVTKTKQNKTKQTNKQTGSASSLVLQHNYFLAWLQVQWLNSKKKN